jgi:hypothetical protein
LQRLAKKIIKLQRESFFGKIIINLRVKMQIKTLLSSSLFCSYCKRHKEKAERENE